MREMTQEVVREVLSQCVHSFWSPIALCSIFDHWGSKLLSLDSHNDVYFYRANGDSLTVNQYLFLVSALGVQIPLDLPCPQNNAEIADIRAQLYCRATYPEKTAVFWGM